MARYDVVIRNAYVDQLAEVFDIGIADGRVIDIADAIDVDADEELDADGNLVSPSFVDCHMHMDKSFAGVGDRVPLHNDDPFDYDRLTAFGANYFAETPQEIIEDNAIRNATLAAANGTSHIRTHVTVDTRSGTKTAEAVLAARERVSDLVDIEIVPYSEQGYLTDRGVEAYVRESIDLGADIVGGMDPLSVDNDIDSVLDIWFDIATDYGIGIDCHIHEIGSLGRYTLNRIAEKTIEHDHVGEVTVSHAFALADAPAEDLNRTLANLTRAGINLITCYTSTRPTMPVRRLMDEDIVLGHGTDNIRDFIFCHGNADVLEGIQVESLKLFADPSAEGFRYFDTNEGLDRLWEMATTESARVLGLQEYGLYEGSKADITVFDAPSRQWCAVTQADRKYVLKNGRVIAETGNLRPDVRPT